MIVAHLIGGLDRGGAESALERLISVRQQAERHIVVSMTDVGAIGQNLAAHGVPVYALKMPHGVPSPRGFLRLVRLLRMVRPDVLQGWMYHANVAATAAAPFVRRPAVIWGLRRSVVSFDEFSRLTAWTIRASARLARSPAAIVANSRAGVDSHIAIGFPSSIRLIPNGFDTAVFRPDPIARRRVRDELGLSPSDIAIGLLARYTLVKRHALFLEAAAVLAAEHPDVRFVLAGAGVEWAQPHLAQQVRQLGLESRVHLLGERNDVPALFAAMDLFSLCSTAEGFPNVVAEAMACGVPGVATRVGDAEAIIGDTGVVVPCGRPEELVHAWRMFLSEGSAGRARRGDRARQRIVERYSLTAVGEAYGALYQEVRKARARAIPVLPAMPVNRHVRSRH